MGTELDIDDVTITLRGIKADYYLPTMSIRLFFEWYGTDVVHIMRVLDDASPKDVADQLRSMAALIEK